MIKGIGVDIVELERIEKILHQNERFIERVLTEEEKVIFDKLQSDKRKIEFLAGRFAAKEAYSKAIGTGLGKLSFQDIEIITDELGAPKISVKEAYGSSIFVSISHSQAYAIAQVIIEK
ncbi:holo-ACP synthase [Aquibacillus halophilus]|uniref:Holo-[acyl-carrier-protein] synthase n=1 Tax=Aquibacillus halophilus TaxID=930132 RepID=A0A6A8DIK2_9BACI|nr:holo-ACP synthase [Aquibacillus halophilus]MRH43629.1 holo-ACP synthase [Aquibacillus halophilus]